MTITGTKEWASQNVSIISGCSNNCRYCYARAMALRFGRIKEPDEWATPRLRETEVERRRRRLSGTVMFPSTHDILLEFLDPCLAVIEKLLEAGNKVLIVSKPHPDCIEAICDRFGDYRSQLVFRFTIGAMQNEILEYWEPGAPAVEQRRWSLMYAGRQGFATSVSCEPLLQAALAQSLYNSLEPFVTDTIWFGTMKHIRQRVVPGTSDSEIRRIEAGQTDQRVREIYEALREKPKVRWKDSYRKVLGLKGPTGPE